MSKTRPRRLTAISFSRLAAAVALASARSVRDAEPVLTIDPPSWRSPRSGGSAFASGGLIPEEEPEIASPIQMMKPKSEIR
jgi:hypothetical protein